MTLFSSLKGKQDPKRISTYSSRITGNHLVAAQCESAKFTTFKKTVVRAIITLEQTCSPRELMKKM